MLLFAIPQELFRVDSEKFELRPSWEAPQSVNAGPETPGEASNTGGRVTRTAEVVEPLSITYDPAKKAFMLEVQYFKYTMFLPSGRSTGGGKPTR